MIKITKVKRKFSSINLIKTINNKQNHQILVLLKVHHSKLDPCKSELTLKLTDIKLKSIIKYKFIIFQFKLERLIKLELGKPIIRIKQPIAKQIITE